LQELNVSDFDCILFVGGAGAIKYLDNDVSYDLIKKADEKNLIIAAICI
jgi:protease I